MDERELEILFKKIRIGSTVIYGKVDSSGQITDIKCVGKVTKIEKCKWKNSDILSCKSDFCIGLIGIDNSNTSCTIFNKNRCKILAVVDDFKFEKELFNIK